MTTLAEGYEEIVVVAGDRHPAIRIQFIDGVTNKPIVGVDLNITFKGRFAERGSDEALYDDVTLTKIDGGKDGWALWEWPAGGTDFDPGKYEIQPYIAYTTGASPHTAQNRVKIKIKAKIAEYDA
jgi:hypothetical protein